VGDPVIVDQRSSAPSRRGVLTRTGSGLAHAEHAPGRSALLEANYSGLGNHERRPFVVVRVERDLLPALAEHRARAV